VHESPADFVVGLCACIEAGVVAVPVQAPVARRGLERIASVAADARPRCVLTSPDVAGTLRSAGLGPGLDGVRWHVGDAAAGAAGWEPPDLAPDDLAVVQYTSGSTGHARGVMLTHRHLLHNLRMIEQGCSLDERSVLVSWLPLFHDMGLIGSVLEALHLGAHCVLMPPADFIRRPARWLEAIDRYRGTMTGGPNFAFDYCVRKVSEPEAEGLDLSSWKVAYVSAEPVRADTLERFERRFAPAGFRRRAFYPCYGLAEASLVVTGPRASDEPVVRAVSGAALAADRAADPAPGDRRELVGSGAALLETRVAIVDPATCRRRAEREVGEVWVRGPSVGAGYLGKPDATRDVFEARIGGEADAGPHLRTGDLGFLDGGELFVTGRLKDMLNVRGTNHYPQDLEVTAERSHPSLVAGGGVALQDEAGRVVVVHEVYEAADGARPGDAPAAIRGAIAGEHGVQVETVALVPRATLPKTTSGKKRRSACRELLLAGRLPIAVQDGGAPAAVAAEPEGGARDLLVATAAEVLGRPRDALDPGRSLVEHGLDSVHAIELAELLRQRLGWSAEPSDLLADRTLAEIAAGAAGGEGGGAAAGAAAARPADRQSPAEAAMQFVHDAHPGTGVLNQGRAVELLGPLDAGALEAACRRLVDRHPALRATHPGVAARAVALPGTPVALDVLDAHGWSDERCEAAIRELLDRPFDLTAEPPCRFALLEREPDRRVLVISAHHIAVDLTSLGVLLRELGTAYDEAVAGSSGAAPGERPEPAMPEPADPDVLVSSWAADLADPPDPLALPLDRPRAHARSGRGSVHHSLVPADTAGELDALRRRLGATTYPVLLAGLATVLSRLSGQDDLVVGAPVSIRPPGARDAVGCLVNTLPLRVDLSGEPGFAALVARCQRTVADALDRRALPLATLVNRLGLKRDPLRNPLFDVMLTTHEVPGLSGAGAALALGRASEPARVGGLLLRPLELRPEASPFDLTVEVARLPEGLGVACQYTTDLFDEHTVAALAERLALVLAAGCAEPERPVAELPILTDADVHAAAPRARPRAYEPGRIDEAIRDRIESSGPCVAVVDARGETTYSELGARAAAVAAQLRAAGVGAEDVVATMLERSADLPAAMLGTMAAGAVYLPLDTDEGDRRLGGRAHDAGARAVLASPAFADRARRFGLPVVVVADRGGAPLELASHRGPEELCYVLYTSGSTGAPNGVEVTHAALLNMVRAVGREIALGPADRWLALTSVSFDIAQLELLGPLVHGATVVIADERNTSDQQALVRLAESSGATVVQTTPARWRLMLDAGWRARDGVRMLSGGEILTAPLAGELLALGGRLWNLYGPTEATVYATFGEVGAAGEGHAVPIGEPVDGMSLHVVDSRLRPQPAGVTGELLLGGAGLARGYRNRPALTAERFVPDPSGSGTRLYRTGDLARRGYDGTVELLGRRDRQLKVSGQRIEPAEVEAALRRHPAVRAALVVPVRETSGGVRLGAYLVAHPEPSAGELREAIEHDLPPRCVPSVYALVEDLPLMPSGKVDRRALPPLELAGGDRLGGMPRTDVERRVASVWRSVLGVEHVGVDDNFFDLGGGSLLLAQVRTLLEDAFARPLHLRDLLEHTSVGALAAWLESPAAASAEPPPAPAANRLAALRARTPALPVDERR
jgi:amino acid adenylation domain-containing protein